jgi:hypothetical protein
MDWPFLVIGLLSAVVMGATATDIEKIPSAGTPDEPKAGETSVYVDTEAEKSFGMLIECLMINEQEGTPGIADSYQSAKWTSLSCLCYVWYIALVPMGEKQWG